MVKKAGRKTAVKPPASRKRTAKSTSGKSKAKTAGKSALKKTAAGRSTALAPAIEKTASLTAAPPSALLFPSPVGDPQPFSTKPSSSGNQNGSSTTTGLNGTTQKFDDGSVVTEATEKLSAIRPGSLKASLTASCRRVQQGATTIVHQVNYSYKQRALSDCTLLTSATGLSLAVPANFQPTAVRTVRATQFGKNDHQDEGTGTPDMGLIQTDSEVFGGSIKISMMVQIFGAQWRSNTKRLAAMIDVFFADRKRLIRVPLVDVGPGENAPSHAEVDLTWASDQFLGTQGGATVSYRILVPT
jgi:hypothetical protein